MRFRDRLKKNQITADKYFKRDEITFRKTNLEDLQSFARIRVTNQILILSISAPILFEWIRIEDDRPESEPD
jgi:hypothetical protein